MQLMREIDHVGVHHRRKHRLKRRVYLSKVGCICALWYMHSITISVRFVQGPNYAWHSDDYDKLSQFGFCIHGCIDG